MDKVNVNHRHAAWDSRGQERPGKQVEYVNLGKRRYERWSPAGGGDIQLDGLSVPRWVGGGNWLKQREVEKR